MGWEKTEVSHCGGGITGRRLVIEDDDEESFEGSMADAEGSPDLKDSAGDGGDELGSLQEVGTPSVIWIPLEGSTTEVEVVAGVSRDENIEGSRTSKVDVGGSTGLEGMIGGVVEGSRVADVPAAGSSQWRVPGADGWRQFHLEDFCQAVDKDEVVKSMAEVMDHHLKFMDAAILRCMSAVKCKETLKELLEERVEWEKEAKGHMANILEKAMKL